MELPESLRGRRQELRRWQRDLSAELVKLPETLRQFREGVANFNVVSQRLAQSTEGIERLNRMYAAGVEETVQRMSGAAAALQKQLDGSGAAKLPADAVRSAIEDFNRTVSTLAELNPLWPFHRPRKD